MPVQITLTAPDVSEIGDAGFRHERAFSGVGVIVQLDGQTYSGQFLRPLGLTLESRRINASDLFVVWNGTRFVRVFRTTVHGHTAFVAVESGNEQDFAELSHVRGHRRGHFTAAGDHRVGAEFLARELFAPAGRSCSASACWHLNGCSQFPKRNPLLEGNPRCGAAPHT